MKKKIHGYMMAGFILLFTAASSTTALAGSWNQDRTRWRYTGDNGLSLTSQWLEEPGTGLWYHFDENGFMETGWILIDGKSYYLDASGAMLAGRMTPDGYYVGTDGAWVEGGAAGNGGGTNESFGGANESSGGANESFGGANESSGGANESSGGAIGSASGTNNENRITSYSDYHVPSNFPDTPANRINTSDPAASTGHITSSALEVVSLVNAQRAQNGYGSLTVNDSLMKAAAVRAEEIVDHFSHTRPNGSASCTVLDDAGIEFLVAGENIAYGQNSPGEVLDAWLNSESHRKNILNSEYTEIGTDCFVLDGVRYWVQIFRFN